MEQPKETDSVEPGYLIIGVDADGERTVIHAGGDPADAQAKWAEVLAELGLEAE